MKLLYVFALTMNGKRRHLKYKIYSKIYDTVILDIGSGPRARSFYSLSRVEKKPALY